MVCLWRRLNHRGPLGSCLSHLNRPQAAWEPPWPARDHRPARQPPVAAMEALRTTSSQCVL